MRIFLGLIVPLIAVYLFWSIGSPPPKSIFWETASGEITGHETESYETGYGPADFTNPIITLESGETRLLNVENVHDAAAVEAEWPAGADVELILDPDGKTAFSADGTADTWNAKVITAGALVILAFFAWSFFSEAGGARLFLGGVGACFIMLPLILLRFMWSFGDPPATSLFWPSEPVETVSNEIETHPWGGGRMRKTAVIMVERSSGDTARLETEGKAEDVVERFAVGTPNSVKRAPDDTLYQKGLQPYFFIAFFMSFIGPIAIGTGLWVIFQAFRGRSGDVG